MSGLDPAAHPPTQSGDQSPERPPHDLATGRSRRRFHRRAAALFGVSSMLLLLIIIGLGHRQHQSLNQQQQQLADQRQQLDQWHSDQQSALGHLAHSSAIIQQQIEQLEADLPVREQRQTETTSQRIEDLRHDLSSLLQDQAETAAQARHRDAERLERLRVEQRELRFSVRQLADELASAREELTAVREELTAAAEMAESAEMLISVSLPEARSRFDAIADVLKNPDSSLDSILLALENLPEVAVLEALSPVANRIGGITWRRSWPNLEESRHLLLTFASSDRVGHQLRRHEITWHHGQILTTEQVALLEPLQVISNQLVLTLHRFGPVDPERPTHCWWHWQHAAFHADQEQPPELRPARIQRPLRRTEPAQLEFLPANALRGLQAPWLSTSVSLDPSTNLERAVLPGAFLDDPDWHAPVLTQAHLEQSRVTQRATLTSANLANAVLSRAAWRQVNLAGANLRHARADHASFSGSDLTGATFNGADLEHANFDGARLILAHFSRANLSQASMRRTLADGINLNGANVSHCSWSSVRFNGADFGGMIGTRFQLFDSDARGSMWYSSRLAGACISRVNLSSANFRQSLLGGATFNRCDWRGADFAAAAFGERQAWLQPTPRFPYGRTEPYRDSLQEIHHQADRTSEGVEVTLPPVMLTLPKFGEATSYRIVAPPADSTNRHRLRPAGAIVQHARDQADRLPDEARGSLVADLHQALTTSPLAASNDAWQRLQHMRFNAEEGIWLLAWLGDEYVVKQTLPTRLHHVNQPGERPVGPDRLAIAGFEGERLYPIEPNAWLMMRALLARDSRNPELAEHPDDLKKVQAAALKFESLYHPHVLQPATLWRDGRLPWLTYQAPPHFNGYRLLSYYQRARQSESNQNESHDQAPEPPDNRPD